MEADLQIHCNTDFRDYYRGTLSLRRLWVLVRWLPDSSAVRTLEREGFPEWTSTAQVLDDLRKVWLVSKGIKEPGPHPMSPLAALNRRQAAQNAARQAEAWRVSQARQAARQAVLAAQREEG